MKRKLTFILNALFFSLLFFGCKGKEVEDTMTVIESDVEDKEVKSEKEQTMTIKFEHFRHATSIITINGKRILIDPVLAPAGAYPPIQLTKNPKRNPLVNLCIDYKELFKVDGVIITHNHNDHFDLLAKKRLPKILPILCQPDDLSAYRELGFTNLTPAEKWTEWLGLQCSSFPGTHGGKFLKSKLGKSSSYLLQNQNGDSIYLTGDTLLTTRVEELLIKHKPNIVIANGGGASLKLVGQITMSSKDIITLSDLLPNSKIIAIHMDSINHCFDTRETLKDIVDGRPIYIPNDGEVRDL